MHFKCVDDEVFNILHQKYGGRSISRLSIAIPTSNPDKNDHIVEINHRRFRIQIMPKVKYLDGLTQSKTVFVSRMATVKELHVQILHEIKSEKFNVP